MALNCSCWMGLLLQLLIVSCQDDAKGNWHRSGRYPRARSDNSRYTWPSTNEDVGELPYIVVVACWCSSTAIYCRSALAAAKNAAGILFVVDSTAPADISATTSDPFKEAAEYVCHHLRTYSFRMACTFVLAVYFMIY
jgi:hypothetical protein